MYKLEQNIESQSLVDRDSFFLRTKEFEVFLTKKEFTEQIWFKVKGSGLRVDIIHKKPFNVEAERLRNSRKGKSGKLANCSWRISRSSANSAVATAELLLNFVNSSVVTDELAGRHSLLPALDAA